MLAVVIAGATLAGTGTSGAAVQPMAQATQADIGGSRLDPYLSVPALATVLARGDVTGDGIDDLVTGGATSTPTSTTGEIRVFVGRQDGLPADSVAYPSIPPGALDIGDVTGDGRLDVVVGGAGALHVLAQQPDGSLGLPVAYATDAWRDLRLADVTGDGKLDVVSLKWSESLEVRQQTPAGTLGPPTVHAVGIEGFNDLEIADVTGDGRVDVVVMSGQGLGPKVFVLPQLANGALGPPVAYGLPDGSTGFGLGVGDVTGDDRTDVLVSNGRNAPGGHVYLLAQQLDGMLAAPVSLGDVESPGPIEVADLDRDGRDDVVVFHPGWESVSVYLQGADGGLTSPVAYEAPYIGFSTQNLLLDDLDHDGTIDVVLGHPTSLAIFLNRTAPEGPTIIRNATAAAGQATVSWTAPSSDGGSPITGYVVTPYVGYSPRPSTTFSSTTTTQTVTGLANDTSYRFRVQAINDIGTGAFSTVTNAVTPTASPPTAPSIVRNASPGDGEATLSWVAPTTPGSSSITGYEVTPYIGLKPQPAQVFDSTATTQVVSGLTNGSQYRFRVRAINPVGTGPYSTVTNPVVPGADADGSLVGSSVVSYAPSCGAVQYRQVFEGTYGAFGAAGGGSFRLAGCWGPGTAGFPASYAGTFVLEPVTGTPLSGTVSGGIPLGGSSTFVLALQPVTGPPIEMTVHWSGSYQLGLPDPITGTFAAA